MSIVRNITQQQKKSNFGHKKAKVSANLSFNVVSC